jgi:hypothetical protein
LLARYGLPGIRAVAPNYAHLILSDGKGYIVERADLLFWLMVVEWQGEAALLAADSGSGKSTTTWALLHNAFSYLTDELCRVDLGTSRVFPYPRALCLNRCWLRRLKSCQTTR